MQKEISELSVPPSAQRGGSEARQALPFRSAGPFLGWRARAAPFHQSDEHNNS
jgi:hypothetical protein